MVALTINAVDAAGRAVMSEVTREHLAGLKYALKIAEEGWPQSALMETIGDLITQASTAPEQEPVAYSYRQLMHDSMGGWESRITKHDPRKNQFVKKDDIQDITPLYTHAAPSETRLLRSALHHIIKTVGQSRSSTRRLRWIQQRAFWALAGREYDNSQFDLPRSAGQTAEKISQKNGELKRELAAATQRAEAAQRTIDGMNEAHWQVVQKLDATERKLGEAVGLFSRVHRDLDACQKVIWLAGVGARGYGFDPAYCEDAQARLAEIDAFLSASAEPANEVKS